MAKLRYRNLDEMIRPKQQGKKHHEMIETIHINKTICKENWKNP